MSNFFLENVNSQLVVNNGILKATGVCHIGCDPLVVSGCNESTNCALLVSGTSPALDLGSMSVTGSCSHVQFTLPANGYAWTDSTRKAPIVVNGTVSIAQNAEIDIDASALRDDLRGTAISLLVATGTKLISLPDAVLARANARGAASTPQYVLSCTSKVLSVTVKNDSGTLLIFR